MKKTKLTINLLRKIVPGKAQKFADSEIPNFQVWVGRQSIAFYLVKKVRGRQYNINIGRWPDMTLEEARQATLQRLGALINHDDINLQIGRKVPTIADAMNNMIRNAKRYNTKKDLVSGYKKIASIASKRIVDVTREEVRALHHEARDTPTLANHAVKNLGTAINRLAKKLNIDLPNPTRGIEMYQERPRKRFLSEVEAPKLMDALIGLQDRARNDVQADALLTMIYTGARKSNVLQMHVDDITHVNGAPVWTVPEDDAKSGREIFIPLNDFAWQIVKKNIGRRKNGYVFLYQGRAMKDVRKTFLRACRMADVENCHIHDLRRTLGSWMLISGQPIEVVSKTLGHSSIKVTETIYAHLLPKTISDATTLAINAMRGR